MLYATGVAPGCSTAREQAQPQHTVQRGTATSMCPRDNARKKGQYILGSWQKAKALSRNIKQARGWVETKSFFI